MKTSTRFRSSGRRTTRTLRRSLTLAALLAATAIVGLLPSAAGAVSGTKPWVVALCKFTDLSSEPSTYTPSYFEQFFSDAGSSKLGALSYWRDISYGNLSVSGTVVKGWNSLGMTRYEWAGLSRYNKIKTCAQTAVGQVDYANYYGVIAIFNDDSAARAASTTLASGINASQTSITVASSAGFPAPPFAVSINDGSSENAEEVHVTAVSGTTWTISRAYEGSTAKAHGANAAVTLYDGGDLGAVGPASGAGPLGVTLGGNNYTLGMVVLPPQTSQTAAMHEMGHGFAYEHSRALSLSTTDYQDCYDMMSADACRNSTRSVYTFQGDFGAAGVLGDANVAASGPGMNAINLDRMGWLSGARVGSWNNCSNGTFTMAALNHAEVSGNQEMRINDVQSIATPDNGMTNSDYLTVELRSKSLWDRGIPADAFVLHLHGQDGYSYWLDTLDGPGGDGALTAGEWYADTTRNVYVAVNSITPASYVGQVTLSTCKIDTTLTLTGATEGDYSDEVTLSGRLSVSGSGAPVPRALVDLSVGSQSCQSTTDPAGNASCTVTLTQTPGSYTESASYGGNPAYEGASTSRAFTIDREDTTLTYGGALTSKYHDAFTASATLADSDSGAALAGRTVDFTLGVGDTCSNATDASGVASCSITPQQPAGSVSMVSAFAGDTFYKASSDSDAFEITKHETTTLYTGRTVILQGQPLTLTAQLLEHPGVPIAGRTMTIALAGQTCTTGPTDASGNASCTLASVAAPALGPQQVTASFAGDAYYLPSSETVNVIVFAFPSRGAFTLGDRTVAGATPSTTVTWWSDSWSTLNRLSGGPVTSSFKGFAGTLSASPPFCGGTWTTLPGNSPPPVSGVPSYMGTLVTTQVRKSGNTYSGNIVQIVVVRTNPGYAPSPSNAGTGTIVATYCP